MGGVGRQIRIFMLFLAAAIVGICSISASLAVNNPGHDSLYVLKIGDSEVVGSINLTGTLNATLVRASSKFFGDYLDIIANGTITTSLSTSAIQAGAGALYIDSTDTYINSKTSTGLVQIGNPVTGGITLNVSGSLLQQNVAVCLSNGTNCLSGNNTGNISSVSAGNGISVQNPGGPTVTVAVAYGDGLALSGTTLVLDNATVCRTDGTGCPESSTPYQSSAAGWTNTSTTTSTGLHVNLTAGNFTVIGGNIGIGTASPDTKLTIQPAAYDTATDGIKFQSFDNTVHSIIQPIKIADAQMNLYLGANQYLNTSGSHDKFDSDDASAAINIRSSNGVIEFYTSNSTTIPSNVRMVVDSTGKVGIGTVAPTQKLEVSGSINISDSTGCVYVPGGGRVCGNSTCTILYSPNNVTVMQVCN